MKNPYHLGFWKIGPVDLRPKTIARQATGIAKSSWNLATKMPGSIGIQTWAAKEIIGANKKSNEAAKKAQQQKALDAYRVELSKGLKYDNVRKKWVNPKVPNAYFDIVQGVWKQDYVSPIDAIDQQKKQQENQERLYTMQMLANSKSQELPIAPIAIGGAALAALLILKG